MQVARKAGEVEIASCQISASAAACILEIHGDGAKFTKSSAWFIRVFGPAQEKLVKLSSRNFFAFKCSLRCAVRKLPTQWKWSARKTVANLILLSFRCELCKSRLAKSCDISCNSFESLEAREESCSLVRLVGMPPWKWFHGQNMGPGPKADQLLIMGPSP